jgi:protein-S-isoprenylcysteine O-methyltransferase Ste14
MSKKNNQALGVPAFTAMIKRISQEKSNQIEKFGDEYREYTKRAGRFFPKLGSR